MHRIRLDRLSRHQHKVDTLRKCGNEQMSFHQRKVIAETDTWPRPKGKIGMTGKLLFSFRCEAFGVKHLWIREVGWCVVQDVGRYDDDVSFRHQIAAYLDIVRSGVKIPHIFLNQLVHVILRNALDGCDDPFVLRWVIDGTQYLQTDGRQTTLYNIHPGHWYRIELVADASAHTITYWAYDPTVDASPVHLGTATVNSAGAFNQIQVNPTYGGNGSPAAQNEFFQYDHIHVRTW